MLLCYYYLDFAAALYLNVHVFSMSVVLLSSVLRSHVVIVHFVIMKEQLFIYNRMVKDVRTPVFRFFYKLFIPIIVILDSSL